MRRDGEKLIIEPSSPKSLLVLLAALEPIEEDFPEFGGQIPDVVDL